MQDLTDGAKNMTINDDLEKTEKERIDILYGLVKSKRDANQLEDLAVQKEIANEAERLEVKTKVMILSYINLFRTKIYHMFNKSCFVSLPGTSLVMWIALWSQHPHPN